MMTALDCLLFALDQDGGTIHQMAEFTGVDPITLMYGKSEFTYLGSEHCAGWCSVNTCSVDFNKSVNFPKHKGSADFWIGVITGVRTMEKLDQIRPALSNRAMKKTFSKG
jgi:hypothetical protein